MTPDAASMAGFGGPPDVSLLEAAMFAGAWFFTALLLLTFLAIASLPVFFIALLLMELGLKITQNLPDPIGKYSKIGGLVFRSLRRNLLRTSLTYAALFVLTGMLTFIYGIVKSIDDLTKEKEGQQMVILTERFGIPSTMPPGYQGAMEAELKKMAPADRPRPLTTAQRKELGIPLSPAGDIKAEELDRLFGGDPATLSGTDRSRLEQLTDQGIRDNTMTWSFVAATLDKDKPTKEKTAVFFVLDPDPISTEMMGLQGLKKADLGEKRWKELMEAMDLLKQDKRNVVIGEDQLKIMNLKVGQEVKFYAINYKDVEFECKIVAAFPSGTRLSTAAAMQTDYFRAKLDEYKAKKGQEHPVYKSSLNLMWVRMPNKPAFERLAGQVNESKEFQKPVKLETFSALVGAVLEPLKDIINGMWWIMLFIGIIMCLVISITIVIGVRERMAELAVMKVLGFLPWQVMWMVVSEAVLIGLYGGLLSAVVVILLPRFISWLNEVLHGNLTFFDAMKFPLEFALYGPLIGIAVGLIGSALPSWNARKVKVSEVFAQVA